MSRYPLRKIVDVTLEPNKEIGFPRSGLQQWHLRFSCGHKVNYGAGPRPELKEFHCVECGPVEPEAA